MTRPDLSLLAAPFPPDDVEWKPGATTRDKTKGLAMAYISSRAVQDRLDEVCGPDGWSNEFKSAPEGGVLCGISIRVIREDGTAEWITKWDGAENTDVEAVKGGLSGAMKRAAVQWGIGRYLYRMPQQWVRLDERGRFAETPRIPAAFLPEGYTGSAAAPRRADRPDDEPPAPPKNRPAVKKTAPKKTAPKGASPKTSDQSTMGRVFAGLKYLGFDNERQRTLAACHLTGVDAGGLGALPDDAAAAALAVVQAAASERYHAHGFAAIEWAMQLGIALDTPAALIAIIDSASFQTAQAAADEVLRE